MANPPSKPPRGIKTPKETVSSYNSNYLPIDYKLYQISLLIIIYLNTNIKNI